MLINSPGGHVESADTIYDVLRFIEPEVTILGTGWVASAGALIFSAAPRERRTDRNHWLNAQEAVAYGLAGRIVDSASALGPTV